MIVKHSGTQVKILKIKKKLINTVDNLVNNQLNHIHNNDISKIYFMHHII
jgi:hypothetical protein